MVLYARGAVMDTDGDLVSVLPEDGWGARVDVGVDVGTGTDES